MLLLSMVENLERARWCLHGCILRHGGCTAHEVSAMRVARAITFGFIGAAGISVRIASCVGVPIQLELILGTFGGAEPSAATFASEVRWASEAQL